jgi:glycosyltransferase involved in cell wall biosynthesis
MPEVSVIIPTRDRWELLSQTALPAALGQEDVDLEVIVVDDGSAAERASHIGALEDARVRVLRHERARGVSAARNAGIAAAKAEWLAFLDDDDVWSPWKLRSQMDRAEAEDAAFAYSGAVAVDGRGRVLYTSYFPGPEHLSDELLVAAVIPAGASNVVARTQVVRELGGFDEGFRHLEDWDLWIRLAARARGAGLPEIHVCMHFHAANKHATHDQSEELDLLVAKHASLRPPRLLRVDRRGYARWVASQHSRAGQHRRAASLYLRVALAHRSPADVLRALDALLGKRFTTMWRRPARDIRPAPPWLQRYPYFAQFARH